MKKKYVKPVSELTLYDVVDVITTSPTDLNDDDTYDVLNNGDASVDNKI